MYILGILFCLYNAVIKRLFVFSNQDKIIHCRLHVNSRWLIRVYVYYLKMLLAC